MLKITYFFKRILIITFIFYIIFFITSNLSENEIEVVPNNINLLSKLTYLDLSFNKISEVPVEIGELSNLETLLALYI